MARRRGAALVVAVGFAAGVAVGWGLGSSQAPAETAEIETARAAEARQAQRADRAERALAKLRDEQRRRRRPEAAESVPEPPVAAPEPAAAESEPAAPAPLGPEERRRRVAEIGAQVPVWFDRADGARLLDALQELAALSPEGREAAMALALRINEDVNGEGTLRLSDVAFYSSLGDPAVRELMSWALHKSETPAGFRVMAAWSLPWTQAATSTLRQFRAALTTETDVTVQRALVANLGRLKHPDAYAALGEILADTETNATLRAQVAGQLDETQDEDLVRALETAAASDPDAAVRAAATASLVGRDPPATGYLVTGTVPDSQAAAAGLRAGDIVVAYNGYSTFTLDALRDATAASEGQEKVSVVVRRGGEEVTVTVRPGRLGVFGRAVEARDRR